MTTNHAPNTFGISMTYKAKGLNTSQDNWQRYSFTVTLKRDGQKITMPYHMGIGHAKDGQTPAPKLIEVLDSLRLDASSADESFEDFCANFGYDPDSRKALATYKACQKARVKVQALLGDDFDAFMSEEYDL